VKIRKHVKSEGGVYIVRLTCGNALCEAALRGEPRPTAERAAESALARWNRRKGGEGNKGGGLDQTPGEIYPKRVKRGEK
jgi:hypothetical protein